MEIKDMKKVTPDRQFLIDRLGFMRNRAGLSARELSQRLGYSIAYIAKFENGDFSIPAEVLLEAIEICGGTREEFFCKNLTNYEETRQLCDSYEMLSQESKETVKNLIKNMK